MRSSDAGEGRAAAGALGGGRYGRPALALAAAVVLLVASAGTARAHGGQFRAPGAPPPSGPGMGPVPLPQAITPGDTWQTWWDLNRMGLLPPRDEALRRQVTTPPEAEAGSREEAWAAQRLAAAQGTIVPFLLRLLDEKADTRDEVAAAALIALGKVGDPKVAAPVLTGWLGRRRAAVVVRESAALGIGLLRRSKASQQADGKDLDGLRDALLRVVDEADGDVRVRAFAALGLGLLADQPCGDEATRDARLVVRALWDRLGRAPAGPDLPVALFTALGLQPPAGVPEAVRDGLRQIALGKAVHGRRWDDVERSHALAAVLRLGGPEARSLLLRTLRRTREGEELKRAALLAVGSLVPGMSAEERVEVAKALALSQAASSDPHTTGLCLLAAGRLLGADLRDGKIDVLAQADPSPRLFAALDRGSPNDRGFAALALAQAADGARASGLARPLLEQTKKALLSGLRQGRGTDALRAAYVVGLGLLDAEEATGPLLDVVRDPGADPVLRGHAAVTLGQMGRKRDEVVPVLRALLREKRGTLLRVQAAMALALYGETAVRSDLLSELSAADSEYHRAHVVIALGRLGDLAAIPDLMAYATDEDRGELPRALGVVALGLLTDPEPRPSLLRLTEGANYPSATGVLYSAYAIF